MNFTRFNCFKIFSSQGLLWHGWYFDSLNHCFGLVFGLKLEHHIDQNGISWPLFVDHSHLVCQLLYFDHLLTFHFAHHFNHFHLDWCCQGPLHSGFQSWFLCLPWIPMINSPSTSSLHYSDHPYPHFHLFGCFWRLSSFGSQLRLVKFVRAISSSGWIDQTVLGVASTIAVYFLVQPVWGGCLIDLSPVDSFAVWICACNNSFTDISAGKLNVVATVPSLESPSTLAHLV